MMDKVHESSELNRSTWSEL